MWGVWCHQTNKVMLLYKTHTHTHTTAWWLYGGWGHTGAVSFKDGKISCFSNVWMCDRFIQNFPSEGLLQNEGVLETGSFTHSRSDRVGLDRDTWTRLIFERQPRGFISSSVGHWHVFSLPPSQSSILQHRVFVSDFCFMSLFLQFQRNVLDMKWVR